MKIRAKLALAFLSLLLSSMPLFVFFLRRIRLQKGFRKQTDLKKRLIAIAMQKVYPSVSADLEKKICNMSVQQLTQGMTSGEFTSEEILLTFLQRLRRDGVQLNAVADEWFDKALHECRERDAERLQGHVRGRLHGIPITVKDTIEVEGMVTWIGSANSTFNQGARDALIIQQLKREGAVVFLKSTMPQLGLSLETLNFVSGRTYHPLDANRSPGGSSGGEAALLGAKCSVLGIATDIAGSIRWPSMCCGITGLKPTTKRVSTYATLKRGGPSTVRGSWGPMARCVEDLQLATDIMIEGSKEDVSICYLPFSWEKVAETSKLRVGYVITDEFLDPPVACKRAVNMTIDALRAQGHEIIEFTPPSLREIMMSGGISFNAMRSKYYSGEAIIPHFNEKIKAYLTLPPFRKIAYDLFCRKKQRNSYSIYLESLQDESVVGYQNNAMKADSLKKEFISRWRQDNLDCVIFPMPFPAMTHDAMTHLIIILNYLIIFNVLDFPAGAVPITKVRENEQFYEGPPDKVTEVIKQMMNESEGLPIGVQVATLPFEEEKCLRVMKEIQDSIPKPN